MSALPMLWRADCHAAGSRPAAAARVDAENGTKVTGRRGWRLAPQRLLRVVALTVTRAPRSVTASAAAVGPVESAAASPGLALCSSSFFRSF